MYEQAKEMLKQIGGQLDNNVFPKVKNGGLVMPSEQAVPSLTLGTETNYDNRTERRSEAGWSTERQGRRGSRTGGSRPSGQAAQVVGAEARYEEELDALHDIYPGAQLWHEEQ